MTDLLEKIREYPAMRFSEFINEGYSNGQYRIRAMTYEQNHSPPHELRAFLAIPEVKKELDKLRFVIKNTPANMLVKIPRAEIVDTLLAQHGFKISPRGKELVYNYLKGNDQYLKEESPDTFEGSMSDDQIISRLWMSKRLKEADDSINNAIVIGSWYGVLPYILKRNNNIKNLTANDNVPGCIKVSKKLNPDIKHVMSDCNDINMGNYDCIINPSVNNIIGNKWFDTIKPKTLMLLQTEDISVEQGCPKNVNEMKQKYPISTILYEGMLQCSDRDGDFTRSMIIGHK